MLHVPTIDIAPLLQKDKKSDENYAKLLEDLQKACIDWGFFYIVNHGVDPEFMEDVTKLMTQFFNLPKELKDEVARFENNFQGYSDSELTKRKVDWKQIFDFSSEKKVPTDNYGMHGVNQWPKQLPQFKNIMINYFQKMEFLSQKLMEVMLQTLTSNEDLISNCFAEGGDTSFCRLNFYPICPTPEINLGVGPHSDAGILTVLYQQDGVSSLQVEKNGEFYDVPPLKDSFVINIGDMTQVWSNGKYKAPVHRVLANHSKTRLSIPFFLNPSYSCVVEPLVESFDCKKNPKKYRPIKWGEFRRGRVQGDYADLGEELQISHYEIQHSHS